MFQSPNQTACLRLNLWTLLGYSATPTYIGSHKEEQQAVGCEVPLGFLQRSHIGVTDCRDEVGMSTSHSPLTPLQSPSQ